MTEDDGSEVISTWLVLNMMLTPGSDHFLVMPSSKLQKMSHHGPK